MQEKYSKIIEVNKMGIELTNPLPWLSRGVNQAIWSKAVTGGFYDP
jgi:hypothetical protein